MFWNEFKGFLSMLGLFLPIAIAVVLIATGHGSMLLLLVGFAITVAIGAFSVLRG